jgi:murein DD-endopeptidase MepM/ murein hydrolase activator NlpD
MSILFADAFQLPFAKSTIGNRFGVHDIVNGHDLYGPQGHRGVDFKVGANAVATAVANAEVVKVFWSNALGNVVVLRHYLHGDNNDVFSGYCHLSNTIAKVGQQLRRGAPVGHTGATGTAAVGPHLHLTMSPDEMGVVWGDVFDPIAFIEKHVTVPTPAGAKPVTTAARKGEGLIVIASRSHISYDTIRKLNPDITPPEYIVQLGQAVRIA